MSDLPSGKVVAREGIDARVREWGERAYAVAAKGKQLGTQYDALGGVESIIRDAVKFGCWLCSEAVKKEHSFYTPDLEQMLDAQLLDEQQAYKEYMALSQHATKHGESGIAGMLEGIALTEKEHAKQIEGMLNQLEDRSRRPSRRFSHSQL